MNHFRRLGQALLFSFSFCLSPFAFGADPVPVVPPPTMDVPLRLIGEASRNYQAVRDYTCMLVKQERVQGQLQPENRMAMSVRSQPFSVSMRWLSPQSSAGQEVCYVAGRNNGMMRVHSKGILGAVGFISVDPRDPRALRESRHMITDAGIGNLIDRLCRSWEMERDLNKTQVRVAEYQFAGRFCTRVETIHPDNSGRQFQTYRTVVYFDKETRLPIRLETYDWPRPGSAPEGDLLECYSYLDLRFNVGLGEEVFRR